MPTGIEEAGLALAIFPLIVSLLDEYKKGVDIIKRVFNWEKSLRSLKRTLEAERQVFENACYRLLDTVFQDGGRKARMLLRDLLSPQWAQNGLVLQIASALGAAQWQTLEGVVLEVKDILAGLLEHVKAGIQLTSSNPLFSRVSRVLSRLHMSSAKRRLELEDLHRNIDTFQYLVRDAGTRKHDAELECDPESYRKLRSRIHTLCQALNESFAGHATERHVATLCLADHVPGLEPLADDHSQLSQLDAEAALEVSFLLHAKQCQWRKAAFRHRENGKCPHTQCARIQNLCGQLHAPEAQLQPQGASGANSNTCLGFVSCSASTSASGSSACYCIDNISIDTKDEVLSLHEVLSAEKRHSRFPFYERDRLKLAIIFAASLLVFQSTPWLKDMWSPRDILFRPTRGDLDDISVLQPCIRQEFPFIAAATRAPAPPMVRNAALYALAKVLIQLIENRPLMAGPPVPGSGQDPEMPKAAELERTIIRKAGKVWADVIRRCLYCEFDVDSGSTTFENDEFVCKVYAKVIKPLAQVLEGLGPPI